MNDDDKTPIRKWEDPPADDLITTDEWDHVTYLIKENLRQCDYEEAGDYYLRNGLPFLRFFELSIESKLIKAGFKKEFIKEELWFKGLIHTINSETGRIYKNYRWDLNPPFGFPSGTYKISEDKHILWINSDIEAALMALESIKKLRALLKSDDTVNIDGIKVFLKSFELVVNLLRSGYIPKQVEGGKIREKAIHAPKEKRNPYILKHCRELKKKRLFSSAEHLLSGFPDMKDAVEVDGAKVYKLVDENGNLKACCEMPNGKIKPVGLRKFHDNYFKEKKTKKG